MQFISRTKKLYNRFSLQITQVQKKRIFRLFNLVMETIANNKIYINLLLKDMSKLKLKRIQSEKLKIGFYSKEIKLFF
jgi:hypothetical protein